MYSIIDDNGDLHGNDSDGCDGDNESTWREPSVPW
jgi:hypothetical protein